MVFDDFPQWLKEYYYRAGKYIETVSSFPVFGRSYMDEYNAVAMAETAKWVIADAAAKDLGMNDPTTNYIVSEYVNNPPVAAAFFEDTCQGTAALNINGRVPDTTQVGSNTWVSASPVLVTDGAGKFERSVTTGIFGGNYDLGETAFTLEVHCEPEYITLIYLKYLDNDNFVRLDIYTTATTDKIEMQVRQAAANQTPASAVVGSTGIADGTPLIVMAYMTTTSVQFTVATAAAPLTLIYDKTITDADLTGTPLVGLATYTKLRVSNGSATLGRTNSKWDYFKGTL